jgi:hypothetical protein
VGAQGGSWQTFSFDEEALVWNRLADVRHTLSR